MFEGFRNFGSNHHDLPTLLGNATMLLRLLALHVDDRHASRIPLAIYLLTAVTICFYIYTYIISVVYCLFWRDDVELLFKILLFSLFISSQIGFIKLMFMYLNSKKLRQLVSEYLQCDAAVVPDSRMSKNVLASLRLVRWRAAIFWVLIISNGILYVLIPILTPGRHFTEDEQILLGLEPMFESPHYEIAFTAECFSVFLTVYAPASITCLIIIIVGYTEAQMLALSQELLHLWEDARRHCELIPKHDNVAVVGCSHNTSNSPNQSGITSLDPENDLIESTTKQRNDRPIQYQSYRRRVDNISTKPANPSTQFHKNQSMLKDFIRYRLISIMKMHAMNINLIKQVNIIFQNAIAIEFILLSFGLIAELLGGLENTYIEVPFALIQVAMDCITGQKLIDANNAFEKALYGCGWEQFEERNKRLVLVLLLSSQKTLRLSAGGVTDLSYISLMNVVRSIYSAYTALRSTIS